jgi:Rrf2 family nitric oxide-sensitive transcriptional repressor
MLSKTVEYALRAAVWLAQSPGTAFSAEAIAQSTAVPRRYLHRVLQDLVKAGLVASQPGPRGGYWLQKPSDEVTVLDIVNAVEPLQRIRRCPLNRSEQTTLCPLHRELDKVYEYLEAAFSRVTLADLVSRARASPPLCTKSG